MISAPTFVWKSELVGSEGELQPPLPESNLATLVLTERRPCFHVAGLSDGQMWMSRCHTRTEVKASE